MLDKLITLLLLHKLWTNTILNNAITWLPLFAAQGNVSLVSTAGGNGIQIRDTGFYQVSYGLTSTQNVIAIFQLQANGVPLETQYQIQTLPFNDNPTTTAATFSQMVSLTAIVQITTNPTTLSLVLTKLTSGTVSTTSGTNSTYFMVQKLH